MNKRNRMDHSFAIHHAYTRGNNKMNIFDDEQDRKVMYKYMHEAVDKYDVKLHAFCLMTNHIHLLVQSSELPIYKYMHNILTRYGRYYNTKYNYEGHVMKHRFG